MTTDKIIDAIREIVWEYVNEAKSEYFAANKLKKLLEKHLQPEKPESECNCKWWRHCEFCRKADSVWAGIEKLKSYYNDYWVTYASNMNIHKKLNEVIDYLNQ